MRTRNLKSKLPIGLRPEECREFYRYEKKVKRRSESRIVYCARPSGHLGLHKDANGFWLVGKELVVPTS